MAKPSKVRSAQIYATRDGGQTWEVQVAELSQRLRAVRFADDRRGWVAGDDGLILYTENGQDWTPLTEPNGSDILALHFASIREGWGWALKADGSLLFTSNGRDWSSPPTGVTPTRVTLTNGMLRGFGEGWGVGPDGRIVHNPDAGPLWETQTTPTRDTLLSIHLDRFGYGWVTGPLGLILHTTTGGKRWTVQNGNTGVNLNSSYAVSARVGWIVGQYGLILHTADGGETWEAQRSPTTQDLHRILALSETEAYAVGDGGTIVHTVDGGTTWTLQECPVETPLYDISLSADGSTLWAAGAWGVVLRAPRSQPLSHVEGKEASDFARY